MAKKIPAIDAYIQKSEPFARPIMLHFRKLVHTVCPDVEERMKWSFPHFDYRGQMMCSMAAFKQHCAIGFWKASLMKDSEQLTSMAKSEAAMGHLGRITSLNDLPSDKKLASLIRDAMKLNDENRKIRPARNKNQQDLEIPSYFMRALRTNKTAQKTFEAFSYSNKKDYVEWVTGAKTEATRESRLETAVEWMSEGKIRNWKYVKARK